MKAILSIPLIILILFSGVIVSFATHYCEGSVVATKISLTGEQATCGMEEATIDNLLTDRFVSHCCDNVTSVYSICNTYFPSSCNAEEQIPLLISVFLVPRHCLCEQDAAINNSKTNIRPPGCYTSNSVTLPDLCIFRI